MTKSEPTPEEKIRSVESQVILIERGNLAQIACPYCGVTTLQGNALCCPTLSRAINAVIDRKDFEQSKETGDQIAENIQKTKPVVLH